MEYYKKYRPKILKNVLGQADAVAALEGLIKDKDRFPHAILFTGPSGCGKTTLGRILAKPLGCGIKTPSGKRNFDFREINCADFRGIDMVREIRGRMELKALNGSSIIYLIDECHQLTSPSQNAMLKMLEDTPKHVYFMLATTDPQKLLRTIRTRCTSINLKALLPTDLERLAKGVMKREKLTLSEDVLDALIVAADGSARQLLVLLNQIASVESGEDQIELLSSPDVEQQAIEIARCLMKKGSTWKQMATILSKVTEDPESIRYMVLGYARTVLLKSGSGRAFQIITCFADNFYDSKAAGLTAACYEVINQS